MTTKNDVLIAMTQMVDALTDYVQGLQPTNQITAERVVEIIKEVVPEPLTESEIEEKIDAAFEDYDPSDHIDISDMISDEVRGAYWFEDAVKDVVRELNFTVEVN